MSVPLEFVDVDFPTRPEFIAGDTTPRIFGTDTGLCYEDLHASIPEREWPAMAEKLAAEKSGLNYLVTRVFDQDGEGACVSDAIAQGHEVKQAEQFGKDQVVHLSAISLYDQIGTSAQSGANVGHGISKASSVGILPLDNQENKARFKHTRPNIGFRRNVPAGWKDTAIRFRLDEVTPIRTVEGLVTALFMGDPVIVGRSRHSICYLRPVYAGGGLRIEYVNSWRITWGYASGGLAGGFGQDSLSLIRSAAQYAYAIRSVVDWRVAA